ncbi:MAG: TonB-dependent receptor [Thermoanaerobaculia bacterium]
MRDPRHSTPPLVALVALAATLLAALPAGAQTTGGLLGRVTDEAGGVLPGVTVTVESAVLQGNRVATTDGQGAFRFSQLTPGTYRLTAELAGFATARQEEVVVSLGRDTSITLALRAATSEEITVVGDVPVVDTRSTTLGTNLETRAIETLPSGRNYSSIAQVTPGVSSDANPENSGQSSITVYGSSGAENTFYVDGVNTTGVEYGFQGKELNFEFIQAIDVKAGGYEAEYGKSTGGIISVITKAGGNELRGDVFGYFDDDSLQSTADPTITTAGVSKGFRRQDYGFDLGGFFVKDKVWYFVAYDKVDNEADVALPAGPQAGQTVTSKSKRDLAAVKLTFNLSQDDSLVATFFQDPRKDTGAINDPDHRLNGDPLTYLGEQKYGGKDYGLRWDGLFGTSWAANAQAARHEEENSIGPATGAGDVIEYRDSDNDGFQTGGFGLIQDKTFQRDFFGGAITGYRGAHEFKAGLEYEIEKADVIKRMSGGQRVDIQRGASGLPVYRHFYWTTLDASVDNAPTSQLETDPEHKNTTFYLQDRWAALPNLNFSFGVRWDRQQILDKFGVKHVDLKKDYAPRLGFTWDPGAQGHQKIFGSFGYYMEQIPMDLVIRSYSGERQARIFNYDPVSVTPDPAAEVDIDGSSGILGGATEPTDPNLKSQYLQEAILGYEQEIRPDVSVGVKGIWREYGRVIEDFVCSADYDYCIGNPTHGIMKEVFTYDVSRTFPAPKPERKYKGVQLDVNKRFSNNWQLMASYLWSKLDGNYDGEYAPFTNVGADPNISAAYDYYDFFTDGRNFDRITNQGPLSNDRRHQFKVSGYYLTPFKLSIGAAAYYRSGTPITRYGFSDGYGRYEFFLTERGAEGRTPSSYEADLHLGYPIQAGPVEINLLLDVFNLMNAQRPILLDQRWGFQESDNSSPTPVNPNYRKPVLRTQPTSLRLGVRLSF